MSEKGGGFGSFLFGIAVGAVVGFFFAPEAGEGTRRKLSGKLRNLRDLAEEKVDEVRGLLAEGQAAAEEDEEDEEPEPSTREQLRQRLQAARRRRGRAPARDEEDEAPPLA